MSFISDTPLTYEPMYATLTTNSNNQTILDINSLTYDVQPNQIYPNGNYYATPYYMVVYDAISNPNLDYDLISTLIDQLQPIYLVLRGFVGEVKTQGTEYMASNQALVYIKQYCTRMQG